MLFHLQKISVSLPQKYALVVPVFSGEAHSFATFFACFSLTSQDKRFLIEALAPAWKGSFLQTQLVYLPAAKRHLLLVGLGDQSAWKRRKFVTVSRVMLRQAMRFRLASLAVFMEPLLSYTGDTPSRVLELLTQNMVMAGYEFRQYKKAPAVGWPDVKEVLVLWKGVLSDDLSEALRVGAVIGEHVNIARELSNESAMHMTPLLFANTIRRFATQHKVRFSALSDVAMQRLGMNGVLAVGQGSTNKPKFVILEYRGGQASQKPVVLVGKGITFDSGGLHIKPALMMDMMHLDMSGAAAAAAAVLAAASLRLPVSVVALLPLAENMVSATSYHPGDIIRMMSGKTVQVAHTDAEGRLVLADALTYAKRYKPKLVIDIATLTGGSMKAFGFRVSALFSADDALAEKLLQLGERSGDYLWRMPLWEEYATEIRGDMSDLMNLGKPAGYGQTIHAAMFLREFAQGYTWAHLDIAPRMTVIDDDHLAPLATGEGVRLFVEFLRSEKSV